MHLPPLAQELGALSALRMPVPDNPHHLHHSHLNLKISSPFWGPLLLLRLLLLAPPLPTKSEEIRGNVCH